MIAGGVVAGTWKTTGDVLVVSWFPEAGKPPAGDLEGEGQRLAEILGRPLDIDVQAA